MAKYKTYNGYANVFADKDGRRYLSGSVHATAELALAIAPTEGRVVGVVQIVWDEPENAPWQPWSAKS